MSGCAMSFEDILAKVKEHPELWLPTHKFYKYKTHQVKAWEQIASELNLEEKLLKTRWKYLKDHYRKEMKKIMAKDIERSRWHYFDQLSFLTEELLSEGKRKMYREPSENDSDPEPLKKVIKTLPEPSSSTSDPSLFMISKLNEITDKIDSHSGSTEDLKNDPDYMFLMSVLPTVRNLSDVQKFVFRGKINEWLLEALTQNEYSEQYEAKYIVDS
ncbi:transcription factor Adf-1-like [Zerene cesonia]|uniref:transcription factor Adf-1-like n=1 Tax=Zerene cesonia TaxID=33412 RepID=UPI0018E54071|nr:transcription factor Adf-1-like [Zerene cesonia]